MAEPRRGCCRGARRGVDVDVAELVDHVGDLVSLPDVCLRLNELLDEPDVNARQIARVVTHDPALTARLLRIVNSAFFGLPRRVETVDHAVTVIGIQELRVLAVASSTVDSFRRLPESLVDMRSFWRHSVYTGLLARALTRARGGEGRERLFVGGLLHDIGQLVMYHVVPDQCRRVMELAGVREEEPYWLEQEVLGFDHAEVGAALMARWDIPDSLRIPVRFHHEPARATDCRADTAMVHIANAVSNTLAPSSRALPARSEIPPLIEPCAWGMSGLDTDAIEPAVEQTRADVSEVLGLIAPAGGASS